MTDFQSYGTALVGPQSRTVTDDGIERLPGWKPQWEPYGEITGNERINIQDPALKQKADNLVALADKLSSYSETPKRERVRQPTMGSRPV